MNLGDAAIISVTGFFVVLFELGLIAVFISLLAKIVSKKEAPAPAEGPALTVTQPVPAPAPAPDVNKVAIPVGTSVGSVDLHNVSDRDAAIIMAIVADQLGVPLNTLEFKSIREV